MEVDSSVSTDPWGLEQRGEPARCSSVLSLGLRRPTCPVIPYSLLFVDKIFNNIITLSLPGLLRWIIRIRTHTTTALSLGGDANYELNNYSGAEARLLSLTCT